MDISKSPVVVLSRNYSTGLGIVRSLGSAGFPVYLIACAKRKGSSDIVASSKYVSWSTEIPIAKSNDDTANAILTELEKLSTLDNNKWVLFPTDDFTALVIDSNRSKLKHNYLMPFVSGQYSITQLMDKTLQSTLAKASGLLVPLEWTIFLGDEIIIPGDMVFPCFVKPLQSTSGSKKEMSICHSSAELKSYLTKLNSIQSNRSILIQEYLNIDKEFDISAVCIDQEIIIPGVIEKSRISKNSLGVTMSGTVHNTEVLGTTLDEIISMLKSFHYTGMVDVELNKCGNRFYFNEVNLRSGGPNYSYFLAGANLPSIAVSELLTGSHESEDERITGFNKTFVYERIAWEDYINSYISRKELDSIINNSDYKLLADDSDPKPGSIFYRRIRLSNIKHKLLKIVGRE